MDLISEQNKLQAEAKQVLDELNLDKLLSVIGEISILGSYSLSLMTWRDIDIHVVSPNIFLDNIFDLAKKLLATNDVRKIELQDNSERKINKHHPDGYYLCIKFRDKNQWKIDIWFLRNPDESTNKYTEDLKDRLTDEAKIIILDIKNQISNNPKYRKSIFSTDIYDAVMNENVSNLVEFEKYLEGKGKNLN